MPLPTLIALVDEGGGPVAWRSSSRRIRRIGGSGPATSIGSDALQSIATTDDRISDRGAGVLRGSEDPSLAEGLRDPLDFLPAEQVVVNFWYRCPRIVISPLRIMR